MNWSDIQEYGNQQFILPLTAHIGIEIAGDALFRPGGRRIALEVLDVQITSFTVHLAHALLSTRDAIRTHATLAIEEQPLIPWLSTERTSTEERGSIELGIRQLRPQFDIGRSLTDQTFKGELRAAVIGINLHNNLNVLPLTLVIEEVRFELGSLKARVKATLRVTVATLTLVFAGLSTPPGHAAFDIWYADHVFQQDVRQVLEGQNCNVHAEWRVEFSSIRELAPRALNYEEPGLTREERALRICNVQIILALVQGGPQLRDGKLGPDTLSNLERYASNNGLPPDIRIPLLRERLLWDARHYKR